MNEETTTDLAGADGIGDVFPHVLATSGHCHDADWLALADEQLTAIERLPAGWDSQGADRPQPEIVEGGQVLLRSLARIPGVGRPHINPTRSGGVQFEWESGPRYCEIELIGSDAAEYFFEDRSERRQIEGSFHLGDSLQEVIELIRRVAMNK